MNIYTTSLFPYIEGDSLAGGKEVALTIKEFRQEVLPGGRDKKEKQILYFQETPKGLILNKTNAKVLIKLYGRETNDWLSKRIKIHAVSVFAFGETHNSVRIIDVVPTAKGGNGHKPDEVLGAPPIWSPEKLLAELNANKDVGGYYDGIEQVFAVIDHRWPDPSDTAGWQNALTRAYEHAMMTMIEAGEDFQDTLIDDLETEPPDAYYSEAE